MTALVSAFARWYHTAHNTVKVFSDDLAYSMLSEQERAGIAANMGKGIGFFNPDFMGTEEEALRWVVDNQLSPSPLGRASFCEQQLRNAVYTGTRQYIIMAAGYDTFAYRQPPWAAALQIIEMDHPATACDKQKRLAAAKIDVPANVTYVAADFASGPWHTALTECSKFDKSKITFCSLLGIAYYLTAEQFVDILRTLSSILPKGSALVFDYPDQDSYTDRAGGRAKKQAMLAGAANEKMLASYAFSEIEALLAANGFLAYEHLTPDEITSQYFDAYNKANPTHQMTAFDNVNYCLAVKQ